MSFGVEQIPQTVPYVKTQKLTLGEVTPYPKWKYHKKYPQGLVVENPMEEDGLGDGWVDSPAEFGVETHPSIDPRDDVQKRLAQIRAAVKATQE